AATSAASAPTPHRCLKVIVNSAPATRVEISVHKQSRHAATSRGGTRNSQRKIQQRVTAETATKAGKPAAGREGASRIRGRRPIVKRNQSLAPASARES